MALLFLLVMAGCASRPPQSVGKPASTALDPRETKLGRQFMDLSLQHSELSGFYLIHAGADGLAARVQIARNAEHTLDVQYFIFRGDETGTLFLEELRRAADRGVRVRILVDDGDTKPGDEHVLQLDAYPNVQVRVFDPFDYRGHNLVLRNLDFLSHKSRLDHRMHNKLLVSDNGIALVGGRNVGNQYFQLDPESQFADDDVFVGGPVVQALSKSFDEFWNSDLVVPAGRLGHGQKPYQPPAVIPVKRGSGIDYVARINSGEPYESLISGRQALVWAPAKVVYDSPEKQFIEKREELGRLMSQRVEAEMANTHMELLIVSAYFVPSKNELALLEGLRTKGVAAKVLTNSLESAPSLAAQSGYDKVRIPLLQAGVKLYEIRARLDSTRGSGQTREVSKYGNYSLHGKLYVFDRQRFFIGSWNYDQRSLHINTEVGLIIDSTELAGQTAKRIDAMMAPTAAYEVILPNDAHGHPKLAWVTEIDHRKVTLTKEPSRGFWQKEGENILSLLPLQPEL